MKMKFVDYVTNLITKHKTCNELEIKTIRYGLEGLFNNITKIIVALILVIIFDLLIEFLCFFIFYLFIRKYSFGLHANKSWICWCTTIPIYVLCPVLIKCIKFNSIAFYLVYIIALTSFILWAPADTPKRPLIHPDKRRKQKIYTCIICIIYFILSIVLNNYIITNSMIFALIVQIIIINPLTYKITKTPFNNYKTYVIKV